jgi:hypothetical protein
MAFGIESNYLASKYFRHSLNSRGVAEREALNVSPYQTFSSVRDNPEDYDANIKSRSRSE